MEKYGLNYFKQISSGCCVKANLRKWFPSGLCWNLRIIFQFHLKRSEPGGIFYLISTSGNILCVWTFNKKDVELKASFANLLKCLSVFDTIFLVSTYNMNTKNKYKVMLVSSLRALASIIKIDFYNGAWSMLLCKP